MPDLVEGQATPEGTRKRANEGVMGDTFYRDHEGLTVSSLGAGTYLGKTDPKARDAYQTAIHNALNAGITVLDTASNYREQASERDIGQALENAGNREGAFIVTKGGFLHGDVDRGAGVRRIVREVYVDEGLLDPKHVAGGSHALAPSFLEHEITASRQNLGIETIDIYLVHNPEIQLEAGIERETVHARLQEAFTTLEKQRAEGNIEHYGIATWDGLRVPPSNPGHIGLETMITLAQQAHEAVGAGNEHGFHGVELPVNLAMPEALTHPTQPWKGEDIPLLEAAQDAGLFVLASASLLQARLLDNIPPVVKEILNVETDVQAALQFARSAPGVTTALVGMGSPKHVTENLNALEGLPIDEKNVTRVLEATDGTPVTSAPQ